MTALAKIVVILGPTASGKSDLAVSLAKKFDGEVISADSRQVYKELDIGTGKITKKEMRGIPHHLLDVASPKKQFTVSEFVNLADKKIKSLIEQKKLPIVCGGTGFYIDALLGEKNIPEVPPNPDLRKKLESKTAEQLFAILKKLDPRRAKNIDAKNPRRLIRAIEICEALGRVPKIEIQDKKYETLKIGIAPITPSPTPSSYNKRKGLPEPSFVVREGGVSYILDELELKNRINKRINKWFKQGLLQEVTNLHKKGLSWKRMSEIGLEYRLVAKYLNSNYTTPKVSNGTFDTSGLKERMQIETYQYAKRQMTWFKKDPSIVWFTPDSNKSLPTDLIQKQIKGFLNHDNF